MIFKVGQQIRVTKPLRTATNSLDMTGKIGTIVHIDDHCTFGVPLLVSFEDIQDPDFHDGGARISYPTRSCLWFAPKDVAVVEKPLVNEKRIDQMTLEDYRRGVKRIKY